MIKDDVRLINDAISSIEDALDKLNSVSDTTKNLRVQRCIDKLFIEKDSLVDIKVWLNSKANCHELDKNPLEVKICDCGFDSCLYSNLKRAGIETLGDIVDLGIKELSYIRNIGAKKIEKIVSVCKSYGLELV